ncbi:MAG: OprD family outer membrane porin [Sulfuricurvum sp.]|nr:OprD family outer membrane porin [Sulfuricurvum sp.]
MKLVKMSLAAAVLLGASAFAIDNIKVSGDAKLFYATSDMGTMDLFDKGNSVADAALRVGVTGDLLKGVSFGLTGYAVSTLGLENNLVSNTWTGAHGAVGNGSQFGAQVNDQAWMGEAWIAATAGKTTAKLGRMELDTPLAFSEKWSVVPNTFEAAVLINQDIPDTTLVGAWVGKGNGTNAVMAGTNHGPVGIDNVVGAGASMNTFMNSGAYAAAAINNSLKFLTAQAWYYNVVNVADAYWLQADWDCQLVKNVKIGVQYADMSPKGLLNGVPDSSAYAAKLAYSGVKDLVVSAAYSKADKDGALSIANVATDNATAQSKLYTEAWWNYGYVGAPGAESVNVTAEYNAGIAKLGAYYTTVDNEIVGSTHKVDEVTLTATKSFGPLDATLAYMSIDAKDQNAGSQYNMVHAYLTLNF